MPARALDGLREIAADYEGLLVDVWGVLHNGLAAFAPALEACRRFRAARGPVVLISNAPVPGEMVERVFDRLGAPRDFYDAAISSGDATRAELIKRAPGPAYAIGPHRDERLYDGTGIAFSGLGEAAFISCTGLFEEPDEREASHEEILAAAKARDLEMVCANPDIVVRIGDRLIACAGAIARDYAEIGGRVVYAGKPHGPIYRLAYEALDAAAGRPIARERVLAVGDGLDTDILGAMNEGLDALFVTSGVNEREADEDAVLQRLKRAGRRPTFFAEALSW